MMNATRREFLTTIGAGAATLALTAHAQDTTARRPNLVFCFTDQMRAQSAGYAGNTVVQTPHLDRLSRESVNFVNAVSGWPVCSPYRGTLLTGQHPHTHGIFLNDAPFRPKGKTLGEALKDAGYTTGYIGKWHLDGHGRSNYIPPERRFGFDFWRVQECTHNYNESYYFDEDGNRLKWEGYDAIAQTRAAQEFIRDRAAGDAPFALFLSWGPPHNPYKTAPEEYRALYKPEDVDLRPNVPVEMAEAARKDIAGYYAHISALDACTKDLLDTIEQAGIGDDTIFVFTSDHGDMLGSQGEQRKQRPWDESIRVPFLLRYPNGLGDGGREMRFSINSVDMMPTMLGLCGVPVPGAVEGTDYSEAIVSGEDPRDVAALLSCHSPFGEWTRAKGGREYRGIRTERYTYVRSLDGPWLLYDNESDLFQLDNLCNREAYADVQKRLEDVLREKLTAANDAFLPGPEYVQRWNYRVDENGTMPYEA